jgi:prepilin-type N-terminal cleavage/methylation domain-containing protein
MQIRKIVFPKKGFSLIEILVVITIIGILAMIVITNVNSARDAARIAKTRADNKAIFDAVLMLESDTGQWPGHKKAYQMESGSSNNEICDDGCDFKLSDPQAGLASTDGLFPNWKGPYLSASQLVDSWGSEYFLDTDYDLNPASGDQGQYGVVIGSYGLNGVGLNQYDADDIYYSLSGN